jgi:hypothetical protein
MGDDGFRKIDRSKNDGSCPEVSCHKKAKYAEYPHREVGKRRLFLKRVFGGPAESFVGLSFLFILTLPLQGNACLSLS